MLSVGIITIHKIHNYGSVFQAYALQRVCEELGYKVEVIDYDFPNSFQFGNKYQIKGDTQPNEPKWIKLLFAQSLLRQHKGIDSFVEKNLKLSPQRYSSPDALKTTPPEYDVYITGSDQVWSPRHCNGDPSFLLYFVPADKKKISYAASIGTNSIPEELKPLFSSLLGRYQHIAIRENSGRELIKELTGKDAEVVLDPTLLLDWKEWNKIATLRRLVKKKYILCYYLNYSFNAFPYVDELAKDIQRKTGYQLVRVARPPHHLALNHTKYRIGASPEDFLALVRDAEMVLTTSFHGTAFAVNYGKPVFTVVQNINASDSRQVSLMQSLGLDDKILSISSPFPQESSFNYDIQVEQQKLEQLRRQSKEYLKNSLCNE